MSEPKRYWVCWHDQRRLDEGEEVSDGGDVMIDYADYARLKAEVEELQRLLTASTYYNTSNQVTRLKAEVERLTKAGDAMAEICFYQEPIAVQAWLFAKTKEGKQP